MFHLSCLPGWKSLLLEISTEKGCWKQNSQADLGNDFPPVCVILYLKRYQLSVTNPYSPSLEQVCDYECSIAILITLLYLFMLIFKVISMHTGLCHAYTHHLCHTPDSVQGNLHFPLLTISPHCRMCFGFCQVPFLGSLAAPGQVAWMDGMKMSFSEKVFGIISLWSGFQLWLCGQHCSSPLSQGDGLSTESTMRSFWHLLLKPDLNNYKNIHTWEVTNLLLRSDTQHRQMLSENPQHIENIPSDSAYLFTVNIYLYYHIHIYS